MRPTHLVRNLVDAFRAGDQILVKGPPGYGKTALIKQAAEQAGMEMILTHPAVADPTDYKGFPARDGDHATFLPFGELWRAIKATRPTVFFVDDLGQAAESVQKALMQLTWGRRVNGHVLPDHVTFVGATNDVRQMSGVTGLLEPVKSRWTSIITLEGHPDDWVSWALDVGLPAILPAFMRSAESTLPDGQHLLYAFKPTKEIENSPCPRTWEFVGRMYARGVRDFEMIAGAVGKPAATQFLAFVELAERCPGLESILMDPDGTEIPEKASLQCLVSTAIGRALNPSNIAQFMRYLWRLPQPMRILCLQDVTRRHAPKAGESPESSAARQASIKALRETASYTQWVVKEGALLAA